MSFRLLGLLAVLVAVLCVGSTAAADTVTFQDGLNNPLTGSPYAGTDDNWLFRITSSSIHSNYNYGADGKIIAGATYTSGVTRRYRSLLRFDLTSLAEEYANIDSVKLRLYVSASDVSVANNLQLFHFTANNGDWVEGTKNGATETGSTCWNYRKYNTTSWGSGTAGTAASDYDGGAIVETAYDSNLTGWMEFVFTDFTFIDDWAAGNNPGMVLRSENDSAYNSKLTFHSSEEAVVANRPQLVIGYTPIPEPSTLALLATGLIGLLYYAWRKRK